MEILELLAEARARMTTQQAESDSALVGALADALSAATDVARCLALASGVPDTDGTARHELLHEAYASARAAASSVRFALFTTHGPATLPRSTAVAERLGSG